MIGAIAGDIIGSVYEFDNIKTTDFRLFSPQCDFTDDSIMTVAVADWLMNDGALRSERLTERMQYYGRLYPNHGYGDKFRLWLRSRSPRPYNSWGNGSAMRVSAVGWLAHSMEETMRLSRQSAEVTHNHPEGIKGAQATAAAVYLARKGASKAEIKRFVAETFGYDLCRTCDGIRPDYRFNVSCQGSVPEAVIAFLESSDYEDAVRLAVSLGGDSDTIACITGGIAEAFYHGVPQPIVSEVCSRLDEPLLDIVHQFYSLVKRQV